MKKHLSIRTFAAALLLACSDMAMAVEPVVPAISQNHLSSKGKNIDIHISSGKDSLQTTYFSLGLLATPYRLDGLGVNVVGTAVQTTANGIQLSGLLNATGRDANGLQIGGIANVVGQDANGVQIGGLMNVTGYNANGVQVAGLMNVNNERMRGIIVGGLMNIGGDRADGLIISGLANITANRSMGVQLAGLMNVTGKSMLGLQASTLLNISGHRTRGVQLAGLANISAHMNGVEIAAANVCPTTIRGAQLGAVNYAKSIDGLQIGGYNHCDSIGSGLQLGLVNYSRSHRVLQLGLANLHPDTRVQWLLFGGNVGKANTAVRFLNHHTYTLVGLGTHYAGLDHKFTAGLTYRAGLHQSLCSRLRLSEDLGYVHIQNFHHKDNNPGVPSSQYDLQGRINLECALTSRFGLFASGGYSIERHYGKSGNTGHKPLLEWGIILF
jgi:hypothetical protein